MVEQVTAPKHAPLAGAPQNLRKVTTPVMLAAEAQQRRLLPRPAQSDGIQKDTTSRRYSKSRNGCLTCKARRRKCDELKPSCSQCLRRNLECGGYTKSIKFVEFGKPLSAGTRNPRSNVQSRLSDAKETPQRSEKPEMAVQPGQLGHVANKGTNTSCATSVSGESGTGGPPSLVLDRPGAIAEPLEMPVTSAATMGNIDFDTSDIHMGVLDMLFPHATTPPTAKGSFLQGTIDLTPNNDCSVEFPSSDLLALADDPGQIPFGIDHELAQEQDPDLSDLCYRFSPSSEDLSQGRLTTAPLFQQPPMANDSPETIAVVFDRRICEVLCIKDSPAGNPWRVIIWPLAQEHAAVYHAVAAMTCFQWSNTLPQVRVRGMHHLQTSITTLTSAANSSMPLKVSLTARLLLAFAESWYYPRSSCGAKHVREAKRLLQAALRTTGSSEELDLHAAEYTHALPLKFLAKTWVYMDVLTRLTCDIAEDVDTDFISQCDSSPYRALTGYRDQIDPLMGCAEPLFPLLGRVADLVRGVRKRLNRPNSPAIVARAVALKQSIEAWAPWVTYGADSTSFDEEALTPMDSDIVQTAYAYKWGALLLLCQAVPELPSRLSCECIAQKILTIIATVPAESKASIFHIFPLMIAGCDTTDRDDRDWVRDRWQRLLTGGNSSGISERCLELTSEVWKRRDSNEKLQQGFGRVGYADEDVTRCKGGYTVKSELHWLSVMKEWGWEVLLG